MQSTVMEKNSTLRVERRNRPGGYRNFANRSLLWLILIEKDWYFIVQYQSLVSPNPTPCVLCFNKLLTINNTLLF